MLFHFLEILRRSGMVVTLLSCLGPHCRIEVEVWWQRVAVWFLRHYRNQWCGTEGVVLVAARPRILSYLGEFKRNCTSDSTGSWSDPDHSHDLSLSSGLLSPAQWLESSSGTSSRDTTMGLEAINTIRVNSTAQLCQMRCKVRLHTLKQFLNFWLTK